MQMQNKLFIGNLSFKLGEEDIRELFEKYGTITEVAIPRNRENDKPRGFAFITFETEDSAKKALALDGHEVDGRKIRVSIATGEKRTGGSGGAGAGRGDRRASSYND